MRDGDCCFKEEEARRNATAKSNQESAYLVQNVLEKRFPAFDLVPYRHFSGRVVVATGRSRYNVRYIHNALRRRGLIRGSFLYWSRRLLRHHHLVPNGRIRSVTVLGFWQKSIQIVPINLICDTSYDVCTSLSRTVLTGIVCR